MNSEEGYKIALDRIRNSGRATALRLDWLNLTELPPEIGKLTALTSLDLENNQLTELPPEIGNLTVLKELVLLSNQLTKLPPEFGNLTALGVVSLHQNELTELPPEIGNLTALRSLYLSGNQLKLLPPELIQLTNLEVLNLSNNELTSLPVGIEKLSLRYVRIDDNPLPASMLGAAKRGGVASLFSLLSCLNDPDHIRWVSKVKLMTTGKDGKTTVRENGIEENRYNSSEESSDMNKSESIWSQKIGKFLFAVFTGVFTYFLSRSIFDEAFSGTGVIGLAIVTVIAAVLVVLN